MDEKEALEKRIDQVIKQKTEVLIRQDSSDKTFFEDLKDICLLNQIRDNIKK